MDTTYNNIDDPNSDLNYFAVFLFDAVRSVTRPSHVYTRDDYETYADARFPAEVTSGSNLADNNLLQGADLFTADLGAWLRDVRDYTNIVYTNERAYCQAFLDGHTGEGQMIATVAPAPVRLQFTRESIEKKAHELYDSYMAELS